MSDVSPSKCFSPSAIINFPPLNCFNTLSSERPFVSPQPPLFQYKRKCKDDFTDPPSSKCPYLTRSLSQAISLHQLTSPFTELKRKWEDDNVKSSPSKRPNLGLPPPLEPSAPPTTQYKCKRKDDFTNPPSSKRPYLARSLSQAISSHQLTFPFTELKRKQEDDDVKSSPSKRSNLGLPPPPEPSAPPPTTQYKHKCKDDSTGPPSSKRPFLAHSLSWVMLRLAQVETSANSRNVKGVVGT